jgi:hypothetical protein
MLALSLQIDICISGNQFKALNTKPAFRGRRKQYTKQTLSSKCITYQQTHL